jgi:endoglucanase
MADWAKGHSNVVSMSLHNELRRSLNDTTLEYNWVNLVGNYTAATDAIHEVNSDILVSWSGMQFDQDLSAVTSGKNLNVAPCYKCDPIRDGYRREPIVFDLDEHPWAKKVFYELHMYSMSEDQDTGDCEIIKAELYRNGFNALGMSKPDACDIIDDCPDAVREVPVVMTEFGWAQDPTLLNDTLQNCIKEFTLEHDISWAVWSLAGSYRIRSGGQDVDDTWALLNHEWDDWRYPEGIEQWWKPWIEDMHKSNETQR